MYRAKVSSWNLRTDHMAATLDALLSTTSIAEVGHAKVVMSKHNSHIGDTPPRR